MKLTPTERAVIDGTLAAVHLDGRPSREIAVALIDSLDDTGLPKSFTNVYRRHLMILGASKVCADWRRRFTRKALTAKGTSVDAPVFAGARNEDGQHVQLRLAGMDLDALKAKRLQLSKSRNTLSREIQLLSDLIALMESDGLSTAGDALERMAVAVAS